MRSVPDALRKLEDALPLEEPVWRSGALPQAAVLVTLSAEAEPQVLLGRRAAHLKHHPGEIAFPGGKRESIDTTPWCTARREANEEAGIEHSQVQPLGELPPLVTRTGFEVHPCVARVPVELPLVIDKQEFESLFRRPLLQFADPALFRIEAMTVGGETRAVPHYQLRGDNIWGVTAAVLAMLANIAYDAGLDLQRDWKQYP